MLPVKGIPVRAYRYILDAVRRFVLAPGVKRFSFKVVAGLHAVRPEWGTILPLYYSNSSVHACLVLDTLTDAFQKHPRYYQTPNPGFASSLDDHVVYLEYSHSKQDAAPAYPALQIPRSWHKRMAWRLCANCRNLFFQTNPDQTRCLISCPTGISGPRTYKRRSVQQLPRALQRRLRAAPKRASLPVAVRWHRAWDKQLGTMPDGELARNLGVPMSLVRARRCDAKIPLYGVGGKRVAWDSRMLAALGRAPDQKVAAQLGISSMTVNTKRRAMGIPAFRPERTPQRVWTAAEARLLVQLTDKAVAKALGIAPRLCQIERQCRGIPNPPRAEYRRMAWPQAVLALLGRKSDKTIAAEFSLKESQVRQKRHELGIRSYVENVWTPEMDALLGTATDATLASYWGLTANQVLTRRWRLKVPGLRQRFVWTPEALNALGRLSDAEFAKRFGVPIVSARVYRRKGRDYWAARAARKIPGPRRAPDYTLTAAPRRKAAYNRTSLAHHQSVTVANA